MMKVLVFGLGYVGCTAAACITSQGHAVVGIDVSQRKVDAVRAGRSPIHEPEIGDMLAAALADGRLDAATQIDAHLDDADLAIVCVGTPSGPDGAHDMTFIVQVTRSIATALHGRERPIAVAYRSTMRPGTIEQIVLPIFQAALGARADLVQLVYNPEFMRESTAVRDYFHPPKVVIGTLDGQVPAAMEELHHGIDAPIFRVGIREAELTKFVDNSWHAVKVAFANEVGRVCEQMSISARVVHDVFVADTKLNISPYYLRPGGAFGGSCLPKDVRALQYMAADVGANTHLVNALFPSNDAHKLHQFARVTRGLSPNASILLIGLAFKADTDDLRESPAVDLARRLLAAGHRLGIYDPGLDPEQLVGQNLGYAYAHLPTIDKLLVDRETAENGDYDLLVATNRLADTLRIDRSKLVDLNSMA